MNINETLKYKKALTNVKVYHNGLVFIRSRKAWNEINNDKSFVLADKEVKQAIDKYFTEWNKYKSKNPYSPPVLSKINLQKSAWIDFGFQLFSINKENGNIMFYNPADHQIATPLSKNAVFANKTININKRSADFEPADTEEGITEIAMDDLDFAEIKRKKSKMFLKTYLQSDTLYIFANSHHTEYDELTELHNCNKQIQTNFVKAAEKTGLKDIEYIKTKHGTTLAYDRFFVKKLHKKIVTAWFNNNTLFAAKYTDNTNFVDHPLVVHHSEKIFCRSSSDEPQEYVAEIYNINTLEMHEMPRKQILFCYTADEETKPYCRSHNYSSVFLKLYDKKMLLRRSIRIPSAAEDTVDISTNPEATAVFTNNFIYVLISAPNVGEEIIYCKVFDKKLNAITSTFLVEEKLIGTDLPAISVIDNQLYISYITKHNEINYLCSRTISPNGKVSNKRYFCDVTYALDINSRIESDKIEIYFSERVQNEVRFRMIEVDVE